MMEVEPLETGGAAAAARMRRVQAGLGCPIPLQQRGIELGCLGFFGFIPCLGGLIVLIGAIWSLVAGVVAIRQALDFDTGKAILTGIVGWVVIVVIYVVLAILGWGVRAVF